MKPAYLFWGSDSAKIAATRARLRSRAEAEGGVAALEVIEPLDGRGAPDVEAAGAAIPALSLVESRRYVLVDGVEKWREGQAKRMAEAMASIPPDTTVVLIAHVGEARKRSKTLVSAVESAGGEVREFEAPKPAAMPRWLIAEARERDFTLAPDAARSLVDRMGTDPIRLGNELDRLELWAGPGGSVEAGDLEEMVADTSDVAVWALSDAVLERDAGRAVTIGQDLLDRENDLTGVVYMTAGRLRKAREALVRLEAGEARQALEGSLGMHPYAAKQLLSRLGETEPADVGRAIEALADLELWTRGGAEYGDKLALTVALRRACGVETG